VFRRRSFLTGQQPRPGAGDDVVWLWTDGAPMTPDHWNSGSLTFAMCAQRANQRVVEHILGLPGEPHLIDEFGPDKIL
jgi:hypothetical protein